MIACTALLCSDIPAEINSLSQLTPEMVIETVVRSLWLITNGDAKVTLPGFRSLMPS